MKEKVRAWLKMKIGKSRQYETLMKKLRHKTMKIGKDLRTKYDARIEHLKKKNELEIEKKVTLNWRN